MATEERVVIVPGKFHKVIWLGVKDIIVVTDRTTVAFKPSPDQLKIFFRSHPEWRQRLTAAQEKVEACRRAVERQPQYAKPTHTTTSLLPKAGDEPLTRRGVGEADDDEEEVVSMPLNPNRNNIKHRVQYFYGEDADTDNDEEEEEEEDE
ncbi:hypothetical protein DQ04_02451120 [Trypanosoma grayi]|uniref:hypothetical protein n=1 Tax=Trypanosoma grayi TaxID=71804 RepID=UPI0004F42350|nr:hypothetical protein DQ04_02451120 [Trypanosoma grayi]KEG11610.1 hypothetical protein DQ04_02451120 [Trypanosoma grayi]